MISLHYHCNEHSINLWGYALVQLVQSNQVMHLPRCVEVGCSNTLVATCTVGDWVCLVAWVWVLGSGCIRSVDEIYVVCVEIVLN